MKKAIVVTVIAVASLGVFACVKSITEKKVTTTSHANGSKDSGKAPCPPSCS